MHQLAFDRYTIFLGTGNNPKNVFCYAGEQLLGQLAFQEPPLPPARVQPSGTLWLPFPLSMLAAVLEVLREEKPLFLLYDERGQIGYLGTSKELVGEQERSE